MSSVHIDTHVAVWLYEARADRLRPALGHLDGHEVAMSPMAVLELQYLFETGRITVPAAAIVGELQQRAGLSISLSPWHDVVRAAVALSWTRDPFDRLIAAHAIVDEAPIVTADEHIRRHCQNAVWG